MPNCSRKKKYFFESKRDPRLDFFFLEKNALLGNERAKVFPINCKIAEQVKGPNIFNQSQFCSSKHGYRAVPPLKC